MDDESKFLENELVNACMSDDSELRLKLMKVIIDKSEKAQQDVFEECVKRLNLDNEDFKLRHKIKAQGRVKKTAKKRI